MPIPPGIFPDAIPTSRGIFAEVIPNPRGIGAVDNISQHFFKFFKFTSPALTYHAARIFRTIPPCQPQPQPQHRTGSIERGEQQPASTRARSGAAPSQPVFGRQTRIGEP